MASVERWKGNRWRARYRTPDGQSRSKVFDRKVDAERHLVAMEHGKLSGAYVDPAAGKVTLATYWTTWAERQPWRTSRGTWRDSYFRNHVDPARRAAAESLRRGDIKRGAGLPCADRTARQIIQYVSTMLDAAAADGLIASNPACGAPRPRVKTQPIVPYTSVGGRSCSARGCAGLVPRSRSISG